MNYRAFWVLESGDIEVIDQTVLPFQYKTVVIQTPVEAARAIRNMTVRGAGTIGSIAAFGVYMAARNSGGDPERMRSEARMIRESRPTAINLMWAVDRVLAATGNLSGQELIERSRTEAMLISDEDRDRTAMIGQFGFELMKRILEEKGKDTIEVLTHCNAGWLGIVDSGTALAPIYEAKRRGVNVHVWVDETRPRNQGSLTSWELSREHIPHTLITDNAGGELMRGGRVDIVFVGADRVVRNGDTANKIGTYLKALAARDNDVPFYVALPTSTFDLDTPNGYDIPIEERNEREVLFVRGLAESGEIQEVRIVPEGIRAFNPAFDITPARLITGLITEKGVIPAREEEIVKMFRG
jgi:methylthioribose-1-phosphate isomerase